MSRPPPYSEKDPSPLSFDQMLWMGIVEPRGAPQATRSTPQTASFGDPISMVAQKLLQGQMQSLDFSNDMNNARLLPQFQQEAQRPGIHAQLHASMKNEAYSAQQQAGKSGAALGQTLLGIPGAVLGQFLGEKLGSSQIDLNTAYGGSGKVNPQVDSTVASASTAPQSIQQEQTQ